MANLSQTSLSLLSYPILISVVLSYFTLPVATKLALVFGLYPWTFTVIYYVLFSTDDIYSVIGFIVLYILFATIIGTCLLGFAFNAVFIWLGNWKIVLLFFLHLITAIINAIGFFVFIFFSLDSRVLLETLGLLLTNAGMTSVLWSVAQLLYIF